MGFGRRGAFGKYGIVRAEGCEVWPKSGLIAMLVITISALLRCQFFSLSGAHSRLYQSPLHVEIVYGNKHEHQTRCLQLNIQLIISAFSGRDKIISYHICIIPDDSDLKFKDI